jgi:hypothetical protein
MRLPDLVISCGLAALPMLATAALAEQKKINTVNGLALGGYDAVTYFTEPEPLPGSPDYALMWRGATWLFVGPETMAMFEMDPKSYAPQFGGYCAYGVAEGQLAPGNPEIFSVIEGRLYLNFSRKQQQEWSANLDSLISQAQANWPDLSGN